MPATTKDLEQAWQLLGQGRFAQAAAKSHDYLRQFPNNVSALACHAMANWKAGGDIGVSLAQLRQAAELAPGVASVAHNHATVLASAGDLGAAAAEFRRALAIKPDDFRAFYGLTQNYRFKEEDELTARMASLFAETREPAAREFLGFALAKAYDDLGQPEKAIDYAEIANGLVQRPFDIAGERTNLADLRAMVAADAFRQLGSSGHPTRAPLFIVGMNRSGTTLVEAILAAHPRVHSLGESAAIVEAEHAALAGSFNAAGRRNAMLGSLSRDWLKGRAETILKLAHQGAGAFDVFTDKQPENAVRLGLVAQLFPNARVIHVRRHPLDAGLSNYMQRFSAGQGFSFRQDWVGERTRQIADSMAEWKRGLDMPILDVAYELLVNDPEPQSRRIVAFAGLEWDDACLAPEQGQRSVRTASQYQVRQPISSRSVGRWRAYEPWLSPMIAAMGGREWIEAEMDAILRDGAA